MSNYSSMKLEFVALKWALTEKFREYLLGQRCIIFTDNNPLSHLSTAKLGALEQRWVAQMAPFNYKVKYRSGRQNRNADALSRQNPSDHPVLGDLALGTTLPTALQRWLRRSLITKPPICTLVRNKIPSSRMLCHIGGEVLNLGLLRDSECPSRHWFSYASGTD